MSRPGVLDLSPEDFAIVNDILRSYVPNRPVYVFGSRTTGRARRRSDLDLAVGGNDPLPLETYASMKDAFSVSDLPIFVDIVDLTHATGIFRKRIEAEWIPFEVAAKQVAQTAVA